MRHILARAQRHVLERFARSRTLLALDYDGTLAPIVTDPGRAAMRASTRRLLGQAARAYPSVVISGRSRSDVARRLRGVPLAAVVGNHGLEPWRARGRPPREAARWIPLLRERLAGIPGVVIEDKGLSLAIHYRKARDRKEARAKVLAAAARLDRVRLLGGKEVLNVLPAGAPDKGRALEQARAREACDAAIYVGDDETDEDAFALGRRGPLLAIRVGRKRGSSAPYFIRAQAEIDLLLGRLLSLRASPPPLGEALEFMRLLWAVDHGLQSHSKQMAATLGVTGPQRLVIRILGRSPGLSAGQLAHVLHLHPSTLTGVLRRLERRGLVTRRRDPADARRAVLGLSAAGRRLDVATPGTVESAMTDVLASLPRRRILAAREALLALAARLNRETPDDPDRAGTSR